ncbi:hypothetical protein N2W53_002034 [Clostridium perfringens]|nr:hypothetical protein [Clostridium perfringens]EJT6542166.1 hypothetical protein [Clostridium perfringens]EJT6567174.1 hypothetical protein [Clostridium perfringens]MBS5995304.1 hypothetical protein [Clostridium perfringens]HCG3022004.1 hypothetical protein [Clostridium perfringens]
MRCHKSFLVNIDYI